ncbi:apical endosomal glycoprotein isoform X2 [Serinus canaria]|uniref:apical endosomal glycoprotein isoform X2 n=1 Tax=Serinus canaria TaxID=9135 RepID=UPI0021CCEF27|nr:apical endosomal glycoprotein isoform X2 [Serinus canaria]
MAAVRQEMLALLVLLARTVLPSGSVVVNSCSSAAEQLCNFVCDCSDCTDENQCGYLRGSAVLGTPFTCDFEDSDCGWQDVGTSTYGWVRGRASLAMWGMGPHSDHTLGTDLGWFLVTTSSPAKTTATAWLRSPEMREAAATCEIKTWYHLSGSCESVQGLNQTERPVLRLALAHRDEVVVLWQSPERSREGWHQLVAYPGRIREQFQLIFSLTQPPTCRAEVALDDIMFRNCGLSEVGQQACGAQESHCHSGSCLAQHRFCDGTDDCGDNSDEGTAQCKNFTRCSFDYDLCGWEMAAGPPVWGRNTSLKLGTSYSIPTRDHSSNSRAGFFLHVSSDSAAQAGGTAQLSSPTFQATNSCSLVLYCHLHGSATSSLIISYVTNSTKHLMRERTGDLGSCWIRERVDFNVTDPFKVLIEGVAGSRGTVAIDDLILSQGCVKEQEKPLVTLPSQAHASPCAADEVACDSGDCIAAELACDFADTCADGSDEKRCGTTTFESGAGGWHDVSVGQLRWGLQKVTESDAFLTGTFLALQTGEGQMVGPAKAQSPLLGPSGPACTMEMSYYIHSDPQGFLAISVTDHTTGTTQLVWQTQHRGNTTGGRVCVPLGERSRPFQVELLALVDLRGSASVSVDNVTFEQCYLDVVSPTAAELSCNFERGMCGWYQDLSSDFKWVHSTGQGQGSDHTTGSGYFLSVDSSVPWSHGQRAQLLSSHQEPAAAPCCLSFWYRLAGPQIGTLNLKLRPEGGEEVVLWTRRGTQGSIWHRAWATLPSTGQQRYQVAFEVLYDGFLGDVGLDDITQTAGPCGTKLSCSFEVEDCGLAASGKGTWQRQSNGTGSTVGPVADHTTGTAAGHYMVVNTGRVSLPAGHTAALTSQPYQPSVSAQCLAFWYQLSAGTPGSLRVFVEQSRVRRKVLSVSTMEGSNWHRSHVTVQPNGDWQVVFEAVGAGGDHGYIALDDLHVSEGACPKPASCDFEQDTCGWSSPLDSRLHSFAWGWKSGITLAKYPGPEQDHTLGTRNGHYMHFDTSVLGARGTSALLEGPPLPTATDSCLRFWYHMDIPEHLCEHCRGREEGSTGPWVSLAPREWAPQSSSPVDHRHSASIPARQRRWPIPSGCCHPSRGWRGWEGSVALEGSGQLVMPGHLCPLLAASGELRVTLHGAAGQRTVWSVAGHRSRGWQGAVVPVQNPSEFQISFEITTRRWPMEGTVALDDIMYSTRVGCHSSPESPVEEKPSGSFVAEVALSVLLALVIVALVAAGGWYWLKQRRLASRTPTENNSSQGFDNITFRDDKVIISPLEGDES